MKNNTSKHPTPILPKPNPIYANTNNEEEQNEKEVVKRSLNVNYCVMSSVTNIARNVINKKNLPLCLIEYFEAFRLNCCLFPLFSFPTSQLGYTFLSESKYS